MVMIALIDGNDDVICVLELFCEQLPVVQKQDSLTDDKFASDPSKN